tara:strand:+ start:233 stop:559 length:327 start_codon:yes stop_codon:yes gene_type:complete
MKISRMNRGNWGNLLAYFDLEVDGFTIKGFRLLEGANGRFVGFPSQKNNDGEYNDTVWADKDKKEQVLEIAKLEYDNSQERQQDMEAPPPPVIGDDAPVQENTEELPF